MIVRCVQCNSAFSVDDSKIENKQFAFTCPKCAYENVFDNRNLSGQEGSGDEYYSNDEESYSEDAPVAEGYDDGAVYADSQYSDEYAGNEGEFETGEGAITDDGEFPIFDEGAAPFNTEDYALDEDTTVSENGEFPLFDEAALPLSAVDDVTDEDLTIPDSGEFPIFDEAALPLSDDMLGDDDDEKIIANINDLPILDEQDTLPLSSMLDDDDDEKIIADINDLPVLDEQDTLPLSSMLDDDDDEKIIADINELPVFNEEAMPLSNDILDDDEAIIADIDDLSVLDGKDTITISDDLDNEEKIIADINDFPIFGNTQVIPPDENIYADVKKTIEANSDDDFPIFNDGGFSSEINTSSNEDESITIDLDSLDIDLADDSVTRTGELVIDNIPIEKVDIDIPELSPKSQILDFSENDEDESITLDLDSLDIPIDETEELKSGIEPDDDEKLTINDAGLTLDDLDGGDDFTEDQLSDDDYLTSDEIKPELSELKVSDFEDEMREVEAILSPNDTIPEIDMLEVEEFEETEISTYDERKIDKFEKSRDDEHGKVKPHIAVFRDDADSTGKRSYSNSDDSDLANEKLYDYNDDSEEEINIVQTSSPVPGSLRGFVSFFIDFSLKHSRLLAFLRLPGLFMIAMIPHIFVLCIYLVLSTILGFLNQLVVLMTGKDVRDFSEVLEKTLRYLLSIKIVAIGVVDDMPIFTGKKNLSHCLQLKIIYPTRFSRLLAALRLSIVGIIIAALPHIIVLAIMGCLLPVMYLMGIFCVIATSRWPYTLFEIMSGYYRYVARVMGFMMGLVDRYPPFKL